MKKRFLTTGRDDDYYDIAYTRPHRNLTRDAVDYMEDEDSDVLDDLPSKVTCRSKHKWDGRYMSNAGKRWLRSKVGSVWNDIRQEFIKYTGDEAKWHVEENTTMIDGVLHIQDMFGPRTLDEIRGGTFYVDENGILQYKKPEKYKRWEYVPHFLIHDGRIWFRRKGNLFYNVPLTSAKKKTWCGRPWAGPAYATYEFCFKHYEHSSHLPWELKETYVNKCDIKQAPKKEIPEAAYELACIE